MSYTTVTTAGCSRGEGERSALTINQIFTSLPNNEWMYLPPFERRMKGGGGSLTRLEARRVKSYFKVRFLSVMVPFKGAGSITVWGCCVWRASVVLLVALSNILSLFLVQNSGSARTLRLCSAAAWQENDHTAGRAGVI